MENLYDKIVNHIILKLLNGDTKLTKQEIARDLNITVSELNDACEKKHMPKFFSELSKSTNTPEWLKKIKPIFEKNKSGKFERDFEAARKRIRRIEEKALKKLSKRRSDDDPPDDVA